MLLNEEQQMIQKLAHEFAQTELMPHAQEWDRTGQLPRNVLRRMGELGFMGMCVEESLGGSGTDQVSYVLALMEIAGGDGGVSTIMSVNNSPVGAAIRSYGDETQKLLLLPPLARGEQIGAFLLSEPQAGSDASNLKTQARKDGQDFILSGTKQFVTSGRIADLAMIFAVTDPEANKRGITCFLTPTTESGYVVLKEEEKLGQHSSETCQILLDNLRVPKDMILGEIGEGYRIALANLETGRIGIAAQAVGMAQSAFNASLKYAKEREAFGVPIFEHQAISFRLADMATKIEVARQGVLHAAAMKDAGKSCLKEASMAKLFASEMAEEVCSDAIQIFGGYGYLADYPVERIYRDVRVCQIYEGTSDIQRMLIARNLTTND